MKRKGRGSRASDVDRRLLLILAVACALPGAFVTFCNEYANHAPARSAEAQEITAATAE